MSEFGVSRCTVLRVIETLSCSAPIFTVQGNGGGVRVADGYYYGRRYLHSDQEALLRKLMPGLQPDEQKTIQSSFSNPKKVMIPCRFSFLHCWEPDSVNGSEPKYSVSAIIPKSDTKTVNAIKAAIEVAKQESLPKWGGKIPPNLKLPLRDGDIDRPEDEAYAGCYFLNANSREKPQVVDKQVQPILDQTEVYSGCYGRITVTFYGYNSNGNRGVAAGLGNIQKLKDGDSLGGRAKASEEFEPVDDDEDFLS